MISDLLMVRMCRIVVIVLFKSIIFFSDGLDDFFGDSSDMFGGHFGFGDGPPSGFGGPGLFGDSPANSGGK